MSTRRAYVKQIFLLLIFLSTFTQLQAEPIDYWVRISRVPGPPLFTDETPGPVLQKFCKWKVELSNTILTPPCYRHESTDYQFTGANARTASAKCTATYSALNCKTGAFIKTIEKSWYITARHYEKEAGFYVQSAPFDTPKNCEADPCNPSNGEVVLSEADIADTGKGISFTRSYRSYGLNRTKGLLGVNWQSSYTQQLDAYPKLFFLNTENPYNPVPVIRSDLYLTQEQACTQGFSQATSKLLSGQVSGATASFENDRCVLLLDGRSVADVPILREDYQPQTISSVNEHIVTRPNGAVLRFRQEGSDWVSVDGHSHVLVELGSEWLLRLNTGATELFDSSGKIIELTSVNGAHTQFQYAGAQLTSVIGPFGDRLELEYAEDRISRVTGPDGSITYSYDGYGNLVQVDYPDGSSKQYLYENMVYVHALTGVINEKGVRSASWDYDASGRVIMNERALETEHYEFSYASDGNTSVTDSAGATRNYVFDIYNGQRKFVEITGDRCDTCGHGDDQQRSYDEQGHITSRTDWNGATTTYVRDDSGLELSRTEAAGTPQARTITTEWHADFRKPVRITEPERVTEYTYDGAGRLLNKTERALP